MKIEIRDHKDNGNFRIKVKTVQITDSAGIISTFIDNLFIHEPLWNKYFNEMPLEKKDEENFTELMRNPEAMKVLTWALGIADYDYPNQQGCFENKQRDYIWEQFIKYGLIEVLEKVEKEPIFDFEELERKLENKDTK